MEAYTSFGHFLNGFLNISDAIYLLLCSSLLCCVLLWAAFTIGRALLVCWVSFCPYINRFSRRHVARTVNRVAIKCCRSLVIFLFISSHFFCFRWWHIAQCVHHVLSKWRWRYVVTSVWLTTFSRSAILYGVVRCIGNGYVLHRAVWQPYLIIRCEVNPGHRLWSIIMFLCSEWRHFTTIE
jgi:hypothetical protein